MRIHLIRERPESWAERKARVRARWAKPFWWMQYQMEWCAYLLNNWTFLEVLEYLSSFGVLVAVLFYFAESGDRLKQKHYQAWQVINTAQGKGGNGGRIDALQELNRDGVPLVGVDLSMAFLQGIQLKRVNLSRANLAGADARKAEMPGANLGRLCGSRVARCGPDRGKPGGHGSGRRGSGRCEVGTLAKREGNECLWSKEGSGGIPGVGVGTRSGGDKGGVSVRARCPERQSGTEVALQGRGLGTSCQETGM